MELNKSILLLLLVILLPIIAIAQELKSNIFLRTPQVINYNFNQEDISYSPVVSIGLGLSHKLSFIELATFINENDVYGFYTFFGTTIKTKKLGGNWKLNTNWFGEITYIPKQSLTSNSFTYTSGLCFFLNYSLKWGSIGFPLCVGAGYNQKTISLNTRTILNISINLN